jgi:hypothetical protein
MRIVSPNPQRPIMADQFLTYVQRFDIIPQINSKLSSSTTAKGPYPDPVSTMYQLKRAKRGNRTLLGDIVPLDQVRTLVELTPWFGDQADTCLRKTNNLTYCSEFWLNEYFDKEIFYALTLPCNP